MKNFLYYLLVASIVISLGLGCGGEGASGYVSPGGRQSSGGSGGEGGIAVTASKSQLTPTPYSSEILQATAKEEKSFIYIYKKEKGKSPNFTALSSLIKDPNWKVAKETEVWVPALNLITTLTTDKNGKITLPNFTINPDVEFNLLIKDKKSDSYFACFAIPEKKKADEGVNIKKGPNKFEGMPNQLQIPNTSKNVSKNPSPPQLLNPDQDVSEGSNPLQIPNYNKTPKAQSEFSKDINETASFKDIVILPVSVVLYPEDLICFYPYSKDKNTLIPASSGIWTVEPANLGKIEDGNFVAISSGVGEIKFKQKNGEKQVSASIEVKALEDFTSISGKVLYKEDNIPLPNLAVKSKDTPLVAVTDKTGEFSLKMFPSKETSLNVYSLEGVLIEKIDKFSPTKEPVEVSLSKVNPEIVNEIFLLAILNSIKDNKEVLELFKNWQFLLSRNTQYKEVSEIITQIIDKLSANSNFVIAEGPIEDSLARRNFSPVILKEALSKTLASQNK